MRLVSFAVLSVMFLAPLATVPSGADHLPPAFPEVALGFTINEVVPAAVPTALAWGPDLGTLPTTSPPEIDAGPDLYYTALTGEVVRLDLTWTPAAPILHGVSIVASGFSQPLGIVFTPADAASPEGSIATAFVTDSHEGDESLRTDGRVTRVDFGPTGTTETVVIDGLPNGRHNANHMRVGTDGLVYLANGNPNDNGVDGGAADVFPYSGAILTFDPETVSLDPQVLRWRDDEGNIIPVDEIATHPLNAAFVESVPSFAYGFRNIFGVAEHNGHWYTATNGADDPSSQDSLFKVVPGADHGFPFCYDEGPAGGVGALIEKNPNPLFPDTDCSTQPKATALLGWHTCTTGLDFPTTGGTWTFPAAMQDSVFVAECATFFAEDWFIQSLADPTNATHNTSHKVVRVALDANGDATEVQDFITGLALPLDVLFAPDGSMFVADAGAILRVAPVTPTL